MDKTTWAPTDKPFIKLDDLREILDFAKRCGEGQVDDLALFAALTEHYNKLEASGYNKAEIGDPKFW